MVRVNEALENYKWSHVAKTVPEDKSWRGLAVDAMGKQYDTFGVGDDPIIQRALADSARSIANGQGMVSGLFEATELYSGKAQDAFGEATVGHAVKFARDEGYKEALPSNASGPMGKYKGTKVKDLDLNNTEQKKVIAALAMLYNQVDRGQLLPQLIEARTKTGLEAIFQ